MTTVRKLPRAQEDLIDIWFRIGADSLANADAFLDFLDRKMPLLAASPGIGRPRPKLGPGIQGFPIEDYIVFYQQAAEGIEVVRVIHGARDITSPFLTPPAIAEPFRIETPPGVPHLLRLRSGRPSPRACGSIGVTIRIPLAGMKRPHPPQRLPTRAA